ncbi:MAG: hypothetical protein JXB20_00995 [Bacilli bacterium]|nr:hypothetical protein [Bacilli bacterium]MBN2696421.1 hypothetical protein [Bacilli bacterium]
MDNLVNYNDLMHRRGRIFMVMGLAVMFMAPVLIWVITGVAPDYDKLFVAVLTLSLLYLPGGIIEVVTYSPFLGTGATYLAFVTGNLVNLKIPCVMNARQIVGTEIGTPENEVVATLSVAFSTITTVSIMTLGILLLIPLRPILNSPVLKPAFDWVVSALFGALGYKYYLRNPKFAIAPIIFVLILGSLAPAFVYGNIAIVVVMAAIVSVGAAKVMHMRKMV